jgi:hypothetical protein
MKLCVSYETFKSIDDRLNLVIAGIARLEARDMAELAALHDEIANLIAASALSQAEKDALAVRIKAALARSVTAEDRLRTALPNSQ